MTVVRLALAGTNENRARTAFAPHHEAKPALLVSFVYLKSFQLGRGGYGFRDWVLDSGAFSAHMSGTDIPLRTFIETAKQLLATDARLTEVFALDVIGDWKASLRNCEAMWKAGVPAIPCYHRGEPLHVLQEMARQYPKIALGGVARTRIQEKNRWAAQCFARVWPKRIHGFGFGSEASVMAMPFHTVDATNWEMGPCAFGTWNTYGDLSVRGKLQNLRPEVEWFLRLEARAKVKWSRELAKLETKQKESA